MLLEYDICLEQDQPVRLLDAVLERMDYTQLLHLYVAKGRNPRVPPMILFKVIAFAMRKETYSLQGLAHQCQMNIEYMWLLEVSGSQLYETIGRFFQRMTLPVLLDLFKQLVWQFTEMDSADF